ncbi:hypothetical protein KP509_35G069700 [Ceratopteris richardii]|uniref:Protein KTI12 homolog n=1 Tax=Ceratopteris richardii TaxID=49495 RepID=A0A8T2QGL2_CERRI|nr:hypothetical protein KP509_35G069700 [Ceratopteris richardii]
MALVVICGQPCSGKSTAAACLIQALSECALSIKLVDEPSLNLDRNTSYSSMPAEKNLRGLLRSEVDRSVSKDTVVIVDSLNSIKGYRYELWCIARSAGIRYCVLYCDAEVDTCKAWNKGRSEQGVGFYEDSVFEDLARRFEEPERKNRWDSPLFHLKPGKETLCNDTVGIVEATAFLKGVNERPGRTTLLKPTVATQNAQASETNSLYELDQATQEVINILVEAQAQGLGGALGRVDIGEGIPPISLDRTVGLAELRRHRRTFIKLTGQTCLSGPPPPSDAWSAKRMFADYLIRELSS